MYLVTFKHSPVVLFCLDTLGTMVKIAPPPPPQKKKTFQHCLHDVPVERKSAKYPSTQSSI